MPAGIHHHRGTRELVAAGGDALRRGLTRDRRGDHHLLRTQLLGHLGRRQDSPRVRHLSVDDDRDTAGQLLHRPLRAVQDQVLADARARLVDRTGQLVHQGAPRLKVRIHLRRRGLGDGPNGREVGPQLDERRHEDVELRPHRLGRVGGDLHPLGRDAEQDAPDVAAARELLAQQRSRPRARGVERRTFGRSGLGHEVPRYASPLSFSSLYQDPHRVPKNTLSVTDNRTGKQYELPIESGTIRAVDLRQIKLAEGDQGLETHDPGFLNTAACRSAISFIDGDKGILRYRGYPIEQLAERSTFLETAYLLLHGELPSAAELDSWVFGVTHHTIVHESIKKFIDGFHHDAHPMGMFVSTVAALSTFYPEAKHIQDETSRRNQIFRLIAKTPTLAAFAHRHSVGLPYAYPDNDLSYTGNFLNMMFKATEVKYTPNKTLEHALDVLFILHANHEQNCSTSAMRGVGSSHADPYSAMAAAAAALYGPLHGGGNEGVLKTLCEIGSQDRIPAYIEPVKPGELRLFGFGHRIYKNYDPRAKIIKRIADEVFDVTGQNPLIDIAVELERIALQDDYFVSRKLYPNVDFYSGIIYEAMKFPIDMFPVLFAIGRTPGWLAQWQEMLLDKDQKIARPRQIYTGPDKRDYVPIGNRG